MTQLEPVAGDAQSLKNVVRSPAQGHWLRRLCATTATPLIVEIKVIWGILLQRFEFDLIDRDVHPDYATFVVGPRHPCRARYRRRRSSCTARVRT